MWLCNVIYFCISNCVCCAQGVAEEQLRLMLPPCLVLVLDYGQKYS